MPQLYENQVQARASQNTYGKAPQIDDYIGRALNNVAELSDSVSQDIAKAEDAQLRLRVEAKTKQALDVLTMADPADFNYESAVARASEIYNSAFEGTTDAAVSRFNRTNPEHAQLFDLAVNKVTLEKSREKVYADFGMNMDLWTSRAALGDISADSFYSALKETNLTNLQKKELQQRFEKGVSEYKVVAHLSHNDMPNMLAAKRIIENDKNMSLEKRTYYAGQINSRIDAMNKKAKDEKSGKENAFFDQQIETYLTIKEKQGLAAAEDYANGLAHGRIISKDGKQVILNTDDPSKANYVSLTQLNTAVKKMRESAATTDIDLVSRAKVNNLANQVIEYKDAVDSAEGIDALVRIGAVKSRDSELEFARKANEIMNSPIYAELDPKQKKQIADVAFKPINDLRKVMGTDDLLYADRTVPGSKRWIWTANKATFANTISSGFNSNDASTMADGIKQGRKVLNKEYLTGDLETERKTESFALTNAYVTLNTLARNPDYLAKIGVGSISQNALDEAFLTVAHGLQVGGAYNRRLEEQNDGVGYFEELVKMTTGLDISEKGKESNEYKTVVSALRTANKFSGSDTTTQPVITQPADVWEIKRDNKGN